MINQHELFIKVLEQTLSSLDFMVAAFETDVQLDFLQDERERLKTSLYFSSRFFDDEHIANKVFQISQALNYLPLVFGAEQFNGFINQLQYSIACYISVSKGFSNSEYKQQDIFSEVT